jgi:hypothetical protein
MIRPGANLNYGSRSATAAPHGQRPAADARSESRGRPDPERTRARAVVNWVGCVCVCVGGGAVIPGPAAAGLPAARPTFAGQGAASGVHPVRRLRVAGRRRRRRWVPQVAAPRRRRRRRRLRRREPGHRVGRAPRWREAELGVTAAPAGRRAPGDRSPLTRWRGRPPVCQPFGARWSRWSDIFEDFELRVGKNCSCHRLGRKGVFLSPRVRSRSIDAAFGRQGRIHCSRFGGFRFHDSHEPERMPGSKPNRSCSRTRALCIFPRSQHKA